MRSCGSTITVSCTVRYTIKICGSFLLILQLSVRTCCTIHSMFPVSVQYILLVTVHIAGCYTIYIVDIFSTSLRHQIKASGH